MGQVFAFEQITQGRVPKLESFGHVVGAARSIFAQEDSIAAAVFFGSVVRGDFNSRSDVDCLVIYHTGEEEVAMEAIHEVGRVARPLCVPVNFVPCDTVLADTRLHHLGTSFIRHVDAAIKTGGHIKGELDDLITPPTHEREEIEWYIRMKMYSLQEAYAGMMSFTEERRLVFLKKMLEAPMHVARKVLIYEKKLAGDSKKEVQARYDEVMSARLVKQFKYLLELDRRYSVELTVQLQRPDEKRYVLTLGDLEKETPNVLEFLRSNILHIAGKC